MHPLGSSLRVLRLRLARWFRSERALSSLLTAALCAVAAPAVRAQDHTIPFDTADAGLTRSIPNWGVATLGYDEVRRTMAFTDANLLNYVFVGFQANTPLVNDDISAAQKTLAANIAGLANMVPNARWVMTFMSGDGVDPWYKPAEGRVYPDRWAALMRAFQRAYNRPMWLTMPFNEPDWGWGQGSPQDLNDILGYLQASTEYSGSLMGVAAVLDVGAARAWYDACRPRATVGTCHTINGSVWSYVDFINHVRATGGVPMNTEAHNVVETIIGAEHGVDAANWWLGANRVRGEFANFSSSGKRIGYYANWDRWTAGSVYRGASGKVKAFLGAGERHAITTSYRLVAKDRPVFFDGDGPRRHYDVTVGGNQENVVDVDWGADVRPKLDGRYLVVNRKSRLVLQVPGGNVNWGPAITQGAFTGGSHQQWDVRPVGGVNTSYYTMLAAHSGASIDLAYNYFNPAASYANGAGVIQYGTGVDFNELWFFDYVGDGYFKIRSAHSNKVLGVNGGSTNNGATVVQWDVTGATDQEWRFIPASVSAYDFLAPAAPAGLSATANAASVSLSWQANTESDIAGYTVLRAASAAGPYEIVARDLVGTSFTDNGAARNQAYHYVVRAVDRSRNQSVYSSSASATPSAAATLVANLGFEGSAADATVNANHASIKGSAAYGPGRVGARALVFNGADTFVDLPSDVASSDQLSVAAWVHWNGGAAWQRIFDFGNDTSQYLFLTPSNGGAMQFSIRNGAVENTLTGPALPSGQWSHVALTLAGNTARLYVNGVNVATSTSITLKPSDFRPVVNYLGKSHFPDALFGGRIDDFRVYNHALAAGEVSALAATAAGTPSTAPVAHLKFDETGGAVAADSAGNGWTGALAGGPAWGLGRFDNALSLAGASSQHVALPSGLVHGLGDFTISSWVRITSHAPWARIFDFGGDTTPSATSGRYLYLAANNGTNLRFAITTAGFANEQGITAAVSPAVGVWNHVAVSQTGATARLYLNGTLVGTNGAMSLTPSSLGITTKNYLGRSQFAGDAYLNGALDDFRVYARGLSASEISALATAPAAHAPVFSANPLTKAPATTGLAYAASLAADATDADAGDTRSFSKVSGPAWLTVAADGTLGGAPPAGASTVHSFTVRVTDAGGLFSDTLLNIAVNNARPAVHLKMDEASGTGAADDSGNGRAGTLVNGPTRVAARLDRGISLDGVNDHVSLPAGILASLNDCTISTWVRTGSSTLWSRVFDFGGGTGNYLFLTLRASTGYPRVAIRSGDGGEELIDGVSAFPLNQWTHVAVTFAGNTGTLYVNGVAVGSNTALSLKPLSLGSTTLNYLGRSQFAADPYFSGVLDEFQIRDRALTAAEIADLASPPNAPAGLSAAAGSGQVGLSWNAVSGATGYAVRRAIVNGGPYSTIGTTAGATAFTDSTVVNGTTYHYVVTARKTVAESAWSAQASATPLAPAQAWRQQHFGTIANTGDAADTADPDGDGKVNLLERAFGSHPLAADAQAGFASDPDAAPLSVVYRRSIAASDLVVTVQESADLVSGAWTSASGTETVLSDDGGVRTIRFTSPLAGASRKFLRLQVVAAP